MERFYIVEGNTALLASERDRVVAWLAPLLPGAEIREVGSTAVPGAIGKGDIDLLVRTPPERFEATRTLLDGLVPRNPNQLSNAIYQGYTVPSPLDIAIQLTVAGGPYDDFVAFLDDLIADPALLAAYNQLKREWHGHSMDEYREAKAAFIEGRRTTVR